MEVPAKFHQLSVSFIFEPDLSGIIGMKIEIEDVLE